MAVKKYFSYTSSINEKMSEIRSNQSSSVSISLRKWRENHPNSYRGTYVYKTRK